MISRRFFHSAKILNSNFFSQTLILPYSGGSTTINLRLVQLGSQKVIVDAYVTNWGLHSEPFKLKSLVGKSFDILENVGKIRVPEINNLPLISLDNHNIIDQLLTDLYKTNK